MNATISLKDREHNTHSAREPQIDEATRKHAIFLVEDHPIVRQGLEQMINHEADLHVCGTAENPDQALEQIAAARPELLVLDISLQGANGLEMLKAAKERCPGLKVLILSMHDERLYAMRALGAG